MIERQLLKYKLWTRLGCDMAKLLARLPAEEGKGF
jgi:hypothetical protein